MEGSEDGAGEGCALSDGAAVPVPADGQTVEPIRAALVPLTVYLTVILMVLTLALRELSKLTQSLKRQLIVELQLMVYHFKMEVQLLQIILILTEMTSKMFKQLNIRELIFSECTTSESGNDRSTSFHFSFSSNSSIQKRNWPQNLK